MSGNIIRKVNASLFKNSDLQRLHDFSMRLLWENGVKFPNDRALDIFRKHGFRIEGQQVYITEDQVYEALKTAPSHFVIHGRNPQNSLDLGGGDRGIPGRLGL